MRVTPMGSLRAGIKAGGISGVVYGAFSAAVIWAELVGLKELFMPVLAVYYYESGAPLSLDELYGIALSTSPINSFITGIIISVIIGVCYGAAFDILPGRSPYVKGLLIGLFLWVVFPVFGGWGDLRYGPAYNAVRLGSSLMGYIFLGCILPFVYMRSIPKER